MKIRALGLAAFTLCVLPSVHAATILSQNFDGLTTGLSVTVVGQFNTINGTNVDIVGGALFGTLCASPESGNCVDMDGSSGNPEGVLQTTSTISLLPGFTYLLSFDLIGSQRGNTASTTVTLGTSGCSGAGCLYNQTFNLASTDDTTGIVSNAVITVSTPTNALLTFTSNTPGFDGDMLDNVLLTSQAVGTVPEPSTFALAGLMLLGVGLLRRARRA